MPLRSPRRRGSGRLIGRLVACALGRSCTWPWPWACLVVCFLTLLVVCFLMARGLAWQGGATLHTVMEAMATLLALLVGVLALVRFHSRKDDTILLIGAIVAFLGTALLDGYHALVTSAAFKDF